MEQMLNNILYFLAIVSFLGFGIFGISSYYEKEKRAVRVSTLLAIGLAGTFLVSTLLSFEAKVEKAPRENAVGFRGAALHTATPPQGIAVTDLSADQQGELSRVLGVLLEPFRGADRQDIRECLAQQGGLEGCRLLFYKEGDIGNDGVWDNWRLEGPAFVWHFRVAPHVHVWVNIADDPSIATNA